MKISAVRLFASNLEDSANFYEKVLGFRTKAGSPKAGYVVFEAGGCDLIVEYVAPDAPADEQSLVGRFSGVSFAVNNIEGLHQRLLALGVEFTGNPERQPWGGTLATLRDPAGNELQLVQGPSTN